MAALGPRDERLLHHARRQGRHEPPDAYTWDALVELALDDLDNDQDHDLGDEPGSQGNGSDQGNGTDEGDGLWGSGDELPPHGQPDR